MESSKKVNWKKPIKVPNKKHITSDLDNTAPISQILDELPYKNKEAFKFFGRNLRQRWSLMKHSLLPNYPLNTFNDDWNGQLLSNYFEPLRYKSIPPQVITCIHNIGKKDPVVEYMQKKLEWNRKLQIHAYTASTFKYEQRLETLNEDVISCPKAIVSLAELLNNDPEPFFDANYNWYYAGFGNLQLIILFDKQYLMYSEFSILYLKDFNKKDVKITSNEPVASFDCGKDCNILEVIHSIESIPIVALRTRNKIFILKMKSGNNLEFEKITVLETEKPFVSISFDTFHKKVLYATLIDSNMYLINVETLLAKKIWLKANTNKHLNNWNIVLSTKKDYYVNVSGNAIHVYDKRTNALEHAYNNIKSIVDETCCNPITVARQFDSNNYLYFGTNHHLFVLDLRFVKQYQLQATQRWTHGMEFPPVYINKCNFERNKDLLCLSSQWCEDMCVISDNKKGEFLSSDNSITIPYRPPSILSVLQEARAQLSCDDIYNPLDSRLSTSIIGTLLIEQANSHDILMLNSLGDITHHTLYPEHMDNVVEDDSVRQLQDWSKSYKTSERIFEVTAMINIADVWKKLIKVPEDAQLVTDVEDEQFNMEEIKETFEKEEIDIELKEVWLEGMETSDK
ncbi:uncharacterized protein LOC111003522 [Pieris rapae]|uniref:uncharacterized protein LOC111003522 n=1 Tax=Pieris rapae TaxID=64459 RepID=UPI001E28159E|nr:uncharacterized protein LOC111003522 [Pieris rapae]